jgi:hypothetical protein
VKLVANQWVLPNEGVRAATYSVKTERGAGFTTRDGIVLRADIHRPLGLTKTPTVLVRIPFTKTIASRLQADVVGHYWASRGYTVVIQGTRGRYESEGRFYPLIHERQDGLETLQWLATQEWYDGRLAMWGGSAFGHTQWAVADQSNPGPNAFFVQIASSRFRKMFYPGNAFSLESALYWAMRSRGSEDREVSMKELEVGVTMLPIIRADDVAIGDTDFYNDWLAKREDEQFWESIDGVGRPARVQAPMLLLAGWYDPFLPGQLEDFVEMTTYAKKAVADQTRLIVGPWGHATSVQVPGMDTAIPYRQSSLAPSLPWFDHYLGQGVEPLAMPRVKLFVMGENRWRDENEWPLTRTVYTTYYLHSQGLANSSSGDGRLDRFMPEEEPFDSFPYDPLHAVPTAGGAMLGDRSGIAPQNAIESRQDVLVYSMSPLSEAIEVTGNIRATLYVKTDAPSTDFTAKLVDVHPDGKAYNVCDGILRRSYRTLGGEAGVPVEIEIELWPTSHLFKSGHRLRLEVSSSNFPRYDRNPNTGAEISTAVETKTAHQAVFHSAAHPSRVILPIIPR